MPDTEIETSRGELKGYLARPLRGAPWPGVVVVHDVFGMTADLRRQCEWLAEAGYLAFAPDLYGWGHKLTCIRSTFRDLSARKGRSFDDIDAVRAWMVSHEDCSGRIGIIGYCMGGGFSLLAAAGRSFEVSSVNYGQVPRDAKALLAGACPVVGSYGSRDRSLRGAASRLSDALAVNGISADIKEYPDAGHGFLNQHDGAPGVIVAIAGRLIGAGYHEPSAVDARRRIIGFFDRYLKGL